MQALPQIESIKEWFSRAVPEPAHKNIQTQIGCHFEEVSEMLATLTSNDSDLKVSLQTMSLGMHILATKVKNEGKVRLKNASGIELETAFLDALCDQIVTAIGVGHMKGYDIIGALEEVNASNWSKFVNGAPIFDENRKIQKGPNYFQAKLRSFLRAV